MRVDKEATVAANFLNKESYVALDGRHIYCGEDAWVARAQAFSKWDRRCARCKKLLLSGEEEWHHKKSKGKHLRDDGPWNREFVCRACHKKEHNREIQYGMGKVAQLL